MGCGADTILSARIVTADGAAQTVSATENAELFWAVRGAGANFGIVTSVTVRVIPEINGGVHYACLLAFPPALVETVVATVEALEMGPDMNADMLFMRAPPAMDPIVAVPLWHAGPKESALQRFAPLFALGGHVVVEGMVPYDHLNDGLDYLCFKSE